MENTIESHFLNLYGMALADTEFDVRELNVILEIASEKGISEEKFRSILLNPESISFQIPNTLEKKVEYLYDYSRVILADGKIDANEDHTIRLFCEKFGFEKTYIDDIVAFLFEKARTKAPFVEVLEEAINLS